MRLLFVRLKKSYNENQPAENITFCRLFVISMLKNQLEKHFNTYYLSGEGGGNVNITMKNYPNPELLISETSESMAESKTKN